MDGPVEVRPEATPNSNSVKFTVNRQLWSGRPRTVASPDEAFGMPLAARLLHLPGVRSLFFLNDFVTVTREPAADWDTIVPAVQQAIIEHFRSAEGDGAANGRD